MQFKCMVCGQWNSEVICPGMDQSIKWNFGPACSAVSCGRTIEIFQEGLDYQTVIDRKQEFGSSESRNRKMVAKTGIYGAVSLLRRVWAENSRRWHNVYLIFNEGRGHFVPWQDICNTQKMAVTITKVGAQKCIGM